LGENRAAHPTAAATAAAGTAHGHGRRNFHGDPNGHSHSELRALVELCGACTLFANARQEMLAIYDVLILSSRGLDASQAGVASVLP
jgi:hypothetical protein